MSSDGSSGRFEFLAEGYFLDWNQGGMRIKATDYHAGTLHLPWDLVLDLAERAMQNPEITEHRPWPRRLQPTDSRWVWLDAGAYRVE